MEGMVGEVYIDNADDNMEQDEAAETVPHHWGQLRDLLLDRAGAEAISSHSWTYAETDVIFLREVADTGTLGELVRQQGGEEVLECSWCDDTFLTSAQMTRHWLLCHLQWDTQCGRCHQPITNSLQRHECEYQCEDCDKTFTTKLKLMRHYFKNHSKFYCCLCEKVFDSLEEYRSHIDMENKMLEQFCILCKAPLNGNFKDHLLKCHFGPIVINKPTVFEDKANSNSEVELITHISLKYKPNKTETYLFDNYSCPHCQRKFSAKSGLKIHVGIAHKGGKIIFCSRCPSAFADVSSCKVHFKDEHSHSARKMMKRKPLVESEPHKSLVPTNLPVEGSERNYNIIANINNNSSASNNNGMEQNITDHNNVSIEPPVKKKPKKPIPGLVKIQDLKSTTDPPTEVQVTPAPLISDRELQQSSQPEAKKVSKKKKPGETGQKVLLTPKQPPAPAPVSPRPPILVTTAAPPMSPMSGVAGVALPQHPLPPTVRPAAPPPPVPGSKPVKAILPAPPAPAPAPSYKVQYAQPAPAPAQQVYVPAMTSSGTTILLKLEEAQKHLNNGVVTFLPSTTSTSTPSPTITSGGQQQQQAVTRTQDPSGGEAAGAGAGAGEADIMREKVALNLPVVMTKRTNKKLAQDNPFFRVRRPEAGGGCLEGECRRCDAVFSFSRPQEMVAHYSGRHDQDISIHAFPLYYELNHKTSKNGSRATIKFFLCYFCGKEFTTKFNVRRHQMLYCVRKDEINPKDLGLGKTQDEETENGAVASKGTDDP